ncbi:hypothetical protein [Paenibacillus sp. sgz500958]|uniref:hypothetical protein n=1 Tax=Paenibacillus sp. sgz500958 TaxID=3242475 RepID=UPI0036D3DFDE
MQLELDEFYESVPEEDKALFSEIADFAYQLGYKPKRAKTQSVNIVFTNNRTKKHLLKFSIEHGKPYLKMKFYATAGYSPLFQEAIRAVIEEYNYKYTGCYQCGKCADELQGYHYSYPDGREFFRCGSELISLPVISREDVPEILKLLHSQHQFYIGMLS